MPKPARWSLKCRKRRSRRATSAGGWHTDRSYDQAPARGSMLYAREVPWSSGDTWFASAYAAYDALWDNRAIWY
jgi:taurine dioxygenase